MVNEVRATDASMSSAMVRTLVRGRFGFTSQMARSSSWRNPLEATRGLRTTMTAPRQVWTWSGALPSQKPRVTCGQ